MQQEYSWEGNTHWTSQEIPHPILSQTHQVHTFLPYFPKVKVKFPCAFPPSNEAPRHEGELREWRYSHTHSLTPVLDGGEWSASRSGRFTPRKIAPGTHWIGETLSNIIFPPTPQTSKWSLPVRFSDQNSVCISLSSHACYMFRPSYPPQFGPKMEILCNTS
jgi:hypothetical protein